MKRLALPLVLLMSLALFGVLTASAQTTTTYTVPQPAPTFNVSGGTMTGYPEGRTGFYPFRAFNIPLETADGQNASIPWIQGGGNSACASQAIPALGFIFITLPDGTNTPCLSATSWAQEGSITGPGTIKCSGPADVKMDFENADPNSPSTYPSGSITLNLDYYYSPGGGGRAGGGAGCYKVITGGTLTLTH